MADKPDNMRPIGMIGLGLLGTALCERLLGAGYEVVVYNRTREKADPLVDNYLNTKAIVVDTGRLVRTAPGDFDNDGFSEARGYHVLQLDGNVAKVHIDARQHPRYSPVFKLVDVANQDLWVYLDGRLIKETHRDQNGNILFELPEIISGSALLEITSLIR